MLACSLAHVSAQTIPVKVQAKELVILDTDIGDDIDDAFALALALRSPELKILQVNSTFGNTSIRSQILERFLTAVGRADITIATGPVSPIPNGHFSQSKYGERDHRDVSRYPDAITATLKLIQEHPGQITLIGLGPLYNIEAMIDKDPETFRKLKRVVIMGGSINRGFNDFAYNTLHRPCAEWNIVNDISGAKKLFASGVSLFVFPLDSTQIKLDEVKREQLFRVDSPITDQLAILYHMWGGITPTLFDVVPVAYVVDPSICLLTPLHVEVDDKGFTRVKDGKPNASVCLDSDSDRFFRFFMPRLLEP
jgi:inosine-uridine nucleoside N-ribohydrolase